MKGVYAYLGNDGIAHFWDAANRGGEPVCGRDDVFPIGGGDEDAPTCEQCEQTVHDLVRALAAEQDALEDISTAMRLDAWQEEDHAVERRQEALELAITPTQEDMDILEGYIPEDWRGDA